MRFCFSYRRDVRVFTEKIIYQFFDITHYALFIVHPVL
jgi:hypothetical protein